MVHNKQGSFGRGVAFLATLATLVLISTVASATEEVKCEIDHAAAVSGGMERCHVSLSPTTDKPTMVNPVLEAVGRKSFKAEVEESAQYVLRLFCPTFELAQVDGSLDGASISKAEVVNECTDRPGTLIVFTARKGMKSARVCDGSEQGECFTVEFEVTPPPASKAEVEAGDTKIAQDVPRQVEEEVQEYEGRAHKRWFALSIGGEWSVDHLFNDQEQYRHGFNLLGEAMVSLNEGNTVYFAPGFMIAQQDRMEAIRRVPNLQPTNQWAGEKSSYIGPTLGLAINPVPWFMVTPRFTVGQMNYVDQTVPVSQLGSMELIVAPARTDKVVAGGLMVDIQFLIAGHVGAYLRADVVQNLQGVPNYRGGAEPGATPGTPETSNYKADWNFGLGVIISPQF
jgi:hypothetical protein